MNPADVQLAAEERSTELDRALVTTFLDNIPDKVFFKDTRSRFIAVSKSCARNICGATRSQIIGRTDFDFFSAQHAQKAYDDEQQIIRTGKPLLNRVERIIWPDGHITWSLTSKMPLRDETGTIIGTFGLSRDITRTKELEQALQQAHKELVDASRAAGRAEVANGVLCNVGSVLNSLNVSASLITNGLRRSKVQSLAKVAGLLRTHQADLGHYLTRDPKGRRLPELIGSLARHAIEERDRLLQEIEALQKNIDEIKQIVAMQQNYATGLGVIEPLAPELVLEDALRLNSATLAHQRVRIERDFQFVPAVLGEKAKLLQILVNLIRNATEACEDTSRTDKRVDIRLEHQGPGAPVRFVVEDNGIGIAGENLTRIFQHGWTTRPGRRGFGLHAAANAAREMNGALVADSPGVGRGARFTLELPVAPPAVPTQ